jgi:hypothetical protein
MMRQSLNHLPTLYWQLAPSLDMDLALWRPPTQRLRDCLVLGVTLGLLEYQADQEMSDILGHLEHQELQEALDLLDLHLMFPATTTNWLYHNP